MASGTNTSDSLKWFSVRKEKIRRKGKGREDHP